MRYTNRQRKIATKRTKDARRRMLDRVALERQIREFAQKTEMLRSQTFVALRWD